MALRFVRHFLLAVQFFTRIPVAGRLADWVGYSPQMLRASAAHFPGVGWIVALVAAGTYAAVWLALRGDEAGISTPADRVGPALAASVFCTIATVLLTGGFHEDGLADVADGLGGSYDRERALDIMKDSRVGAFGAMALMLALLAKVSLLVVLGSRGLAPALAALLAAHAWSRFCPLVLVRVLPHVGDTARSKSKPLGDAITSAALGIAFVWCLPPLVLTGFAQGLGFVLAGMGAALLALAWMWRLFSRRLQGFTGDCLGATQQVVEIAFYLGAAAALAGAR